jgi:hypothetical protein
MIMDDDPITCLNRDLVRVPDRLVPLTAPAIGYGKSSDGDLGSAGSHQPVDISGINHPHSTEQADLHAVGRANGTAVSRSYSAIWLYSSTRKGRAETAAAS